MELLKFVGTNWDTIGLLVTNIIALYINPPKKRGKENG
jgi:hypothetical protein